MDVARRGILQCETRPGEARLCLRQKLLGLAHACRCGVQLIRCTRKAVVKRLGRGGHSMVVWLHDPGPCVPRPWWR
jgi:hypothetical protein